MRGPQGYDMYLREVICSSGIWHVLARGKLVRGPQGYDMYLREVSWCGVLRDMTCTCER